MCMAQFIDEKLWREALSRPDWYLLLEDDFKRLERLARGQTDPMKRKAVKREAYQMVEDALREGRMSLASSGEDLDRQRKPIDTIVIHHTANPPGMSLDRLNAMQLLRIYGSYYANPTDPAETNFKGRPVWSGHFLGKTQVFWGYHWLLRQEGEVERILDDSSIGWHAGNWDINTRSIGICLDDDLRDKQPDDAVLDSLAQVINDHYGNVRPENIIGHCDASKHTECPGNLFHKTWRTKLLQKIY